MAVIQIRVDDNLKAEADALFADIGLDTPTAIRAFLKQSVLRQGIPFSLSREIPNSETFSALEEVRRMKQNPGAYKSYSNVDDMFRDLLNDDV